MAKKPTIEKTTTTESAAVAVPTPTKTGITADIYGTILTLTFSDGNELIVDAANLSEDIRGAAIMHGLKQKLVDAAAIPRNTDTGRSATLADKYDAIKEVADRITSIGGTWNKVRGDGESAGNGLLVRALMQMSGKSRSEMETKLEPMSKEQKAALRNNPKVAAIIAELKAAQSDIDSDELLNELL